MATRMGAMTGAGSQAGGAAGSLLRPGKFPALTHAGPTTFGRYLLLDLIAVGGMADVYVATTGGAGGLPRLVAVKRLLPMITATPDFVAMFADEAEVMRRLTHPSLPRVFEYGQYAGAHFIAMELVRGLDLRTLLDELVAMGRRMPPTMVAWLGLHICRALAHAHEQQDARGRSLGLVHRDVSPNNLMLGWDGQVKLIDFGIARHSARSIQTTARVIKGTIGYMSPEQASGDHLDQRSDLYSLGSCMFEMLTGHRLFHDEDRMRLLKKVRSGRVRSPSDLCPDIPEELSAILLDVLRHNPRRRPKTASVLAQRLEGFLHGQSVRLRPGLVAGWMQSVFSEAHAVETQWLEGLGAAWDPVVARTARRYSGVPVCSEAVTDPDTTLMDLRPPDFCATMA